MFRPSIVLSVSICVHPWLRCFAFAASGQQLICLSGVIQPVFNSRIQPCTSLNEIPEPADCFPAREPVPAGVGGVSFDGIPNKGRAGIQAGAAEIRAGESRNSAPENTA